MWTRLVIITAIILSALAIYFAPNFPRVAGLKGVQTQTQNLDPKPVRIESFIQAPQISARSAIVIDAQTGIVLYEKNPHLRHLPASLTKLATALTVLEACPKDQVVTVNFVESQQNQMGLSLGDTLTVESLLYGLLVASANDAAYALADSCALTTNQFIEEINQLARRLGMENSHFTNPAGFDDSAHFVTASDLARLAKAAVANPLIAKIVATKSVVVNDVTGIKTYHLENTNQLLGEVSGIEGIKTGLTEGSLQDLAAKTKRNANSIITIVLGSQDRFGETRELIEWTFANYQWIKD